MVVGLVVEEEPSLSMRALAAGLEWMVEIGTLKFDYMNLPSCLMKET